MRSLIFVPLLISVLLPAVDVQGAPPRTAPAPPQGTAPAAGKRPSLLQRLFFGDNLAPAPTPTPGPVAAPTPAAKRRTRVKATPAESEKPAAPRAATSSKASKPKVTKADSVEKVDFAGMDDASKFKAVKAKALEDPEIKELKSKADSEVDDVEAHKALVTYNRALFRKIREIEPSLGEYVGKVEESMSRRIDTEKGKE